MKTEIIYITYIKTTESIDEHIPKVLTLLHLSIICNMTICILYTVSILC